MPATVLLWLLWPADSLRCAIVGLPVLRTSTLLAVTAIRRAGETEAAAARNVSVSAPAGIRASVGDAVATAPVAAVLAVTAPSPAAAILAAVITTLLATAIASATTVAALSAAVAVVAPVAAVSLAAAVAAPGTAVLAAVAALPATISTPAAAVSIPAVAGAAAAVAPITAPVTSPAAVAATVKARAESVVLPPIPGTPPPASTPTALAPPGHLAVISPVASAAVGKAPVAASVATGAPDVIAVEDSVGVPVEPPSKPAEGEGRERIEVDSRPPSDVAAAYIAAPSKAWIWIQSLAIYDPGIVLRNINDLRSWRSYLNLALVDNDFLLLRVLKVSSRLCATTQHLDGLHHVLWLVVIRIAEVGGPLEVLREHVENLREGSKAFDAWIPTGLSVCAGSNLLRRGTALHL